MKNYATEYQRKTLILSAARNRVYLSTNFAHKLLLDNKERKYMETEKTIYRRSTSPIYLTQESCNHCDCSIESMKNTNVSVSSDTRFKTWSLTHSLKHLIPYNI
jgi:hypothetical protein